jgi:hypothetical protein
MHDSFFFAFFIFFYRAFFTSKKYVQKPIAGVLLILARVNRVIAPTLVRTFNTQHSRITDFLVFILTKIRLA